MILYDTLRRVNNLELMSNIAEHTCFITRGNSVCIKSGNENGQHLHYPYPALDHR